MTLATSCSGLLENVGVCAVCDGGGWGKREWQSGINTDCLTERRPSLRCALQRWRGGLREGGEGRGCGAVCREHCGNHVPSSHLRSKRISCLQTHQSRAQVMLCCEVRKQHGGALLRHCVSNCASLCSQFVRQLTYSHSSAVLSEVHTRTIRQHTRQGTGWTRRCTQRETDDTVHTETEV